MKRLSIIFLLFVVVGCAQKKVEKFVPVSFPRVQVPVAYAGDSKAALEYTIMHYWDGITDTTRSFPCDSSLVSGVKKGDVEQSFADYVGVLEALDCDLARKGIRRMYERAVLCEKEDTSSNVFETVTELAEKYLYDPNSPLRNEELYLPFVEMLAQYDGFDTAVRSSYAFAAQMCSLNRIDSVATDFAFSDKYGNIRTLHGLKNEYVLLFFSNPGCEACKEIILSLKGDEEVCRMIKDGTLAVVNIYIDENIAEWYDYMSFYPEEWYNGYDHNAVIRTDLLYNVRAIPSLYVLDKEKRVLMKDAPEGRVMAFLDSLSENY